MPALAPPSAPSFETVIRRVTLAIALDVSSSDALETADAYFRALDALVAFLRVKHGVTGAPGSVLRAVAALEEDRRTLAARCIYPCADELPEYLREERGGLLAAELSLARAELLASNVVSSLWLPALNKLAARGYDRVERPGDGPPEVLFPGGRRLPVSAVSLLCGEGSPVDSGPWVEALWAAGEAGARVQAPHATTPHRGISFVCELPQNVSDLLDE